MSTWHWPRRSGLWIAALTILGAICLLVLPLVTLGPYRIVAIAQAILPVLSVLALSVAAIFLWRKKPAVGLCLGVSAMLALLPGAFASQKTYGVSSTMCSGTAELSVLSLNAGRGSADPTELAAIIEQNRPDVLVLVESNEALIKALALQMTGWEYIHRTGEIIHGGSVDTVILSNLPLRQESDAVKQSELVLFDAPVAVVKDPYLGDIRIAGIHPVPPTHQPTSWEHTLGALTLWHTEQDDMPLVMAGDFNATYSHPQFRALASGFRDASPYLGPVGMATWPANSTLPAFSTIDHVLVRDLLPVSAERFTVSGTDHHGILATLRSGCSR